MLKIIELKDINFSYNNQIILENISIEVHEKDFMAILGPNGGGKTTLLKLLLGLLKPDSGKIKIFDREPVRARKQIGYVSQYAEFDKDFPILVKEVVMMSCLKFNSFFPWYSRAVEKKALNLLDSLHISNIAQKKIGELSGGQKQRTLIARALMTDPQILLLDEPMASIDPHVEEDIYHLLKELNKEITIVFVTHDVGVISAYVNKVTCLNVCSCTQTIEELDNKSLIEVYNGSFKRIEHKCNL